MKTHFWSLKSCLNDAVMVKPIKPIMLLAMVHSQRCSIVIKDYCFLELQLVISYFSAMLINFHLKEAIEFTTTDES